MHHIGSNKSWIANEEANNRSNHATRVYLRLTGVVCNARTTSHTIVERTIFIHFIFFFCSFQFYFCFDLNFDWKDVRNMSEVSPMFLTVNWSFQYSFQYCSLSMSRNCLPKKFFNSIYEFFVSASKIKRIVLIYNNKTYKNYFINSLADRKNYVIFSNFWTFLLQILALYYTLLVKLVK